VIISSVVVYNYSAKQHRLHHSTKTGKIYYFVISASTLQVSSASHENLSLPALIPGHCSVVISQHCLLVLAVMTII